MLSGAVLISAGGARVTPPGQAADPPQVAEVICDESGASLVTPTVGATAEGVVISVDNRGGADLLYLRGPQVSPFLEAGEQRLGPFDLAPGSHEVGCFATPFRLAEVSDAAWVSLEVTDPAGHYMPAELGCPESEQISLVSHVAPEGSGKEEAVRASLTGVRTNDEVRHVHYPEGRRSVFAVDRNGQTAALVTARVVGDRWAVSGYGCADAGVRDVKGNGSSPG